jgi:hypothetical protein
MSRRTKSYLDLGSFAAGEASAGRSRGSMRRERFRADTA